MKERYVPTHNKAIEGKGYVVYVNEDKKTAMMYTGRKRKYDWFFRFKSVEDMMVYINEKITCYQHFQELKAKERASRRGFETSIKVGDILVSSWGWEQTNVDFYQVVERRGKTTVLLRKISRTVTETGYMSGEAMPVKDNFIGDEVLKKRVQKGEVVKISDSQRAYPWGGKPMHVSWYG